MAFSYSGFMALMTEYIDELPNIQFINNSPLSHITQLLFEQIHIDVDSDSTIEDIITVVISQLEVIMHKTENANMVANLDKISGQLTIEVSSAFQQLRYNISSLVDSLVAEIDKRNVEALKMDGAEFLLGDHVEPSTDFNVLRWGQLSQNNYVAEVINGASKVVSLASNEITESTWAYVRNALPIDGFIPVILHEDIFNELCAKLNGVVTTHNLEEVTDAFNIFLTAQRFTGLCQNIVKNADGSAEGVSWLLGRTLLLKQMIKAISIIPMDLSADTKANIMNNTGLVQTVIYMAEVYLILQRDKYANSLILTKDILNGDNFTKFINAGGTAADIAYHIRAYYDDIDQLPTYGISLDRVNQFKTQVNEIITSKNQQIMMKMKIIKSKAMNIAVHETLDLYLKGISQEVLPENYTTMAFYLEKYPIITTILDQFQAQKDNIIDAVYRFVLKVWYDKQLVQTLYNYLGTKYIRLAEQGAVNDEGVTIADAYVAATLIGEYFAQRHIVKI